MIVSGSGSITGSVVQILRIIKSFSSTLCHRSCITFLPEVVCILGNDSNLLIVFYVQIMPDDFVMQLHR
ncbi:hypothetical protein, partial [Escherichia coli]|uniref:hypothetical protein n=1 Tax=Escherichia coli TaxID=562 RepID=UPI00201FE446